MYQAVDKGPIFYAEDGAESAGQWKKPAIYQDGEDEEVQEVDDRMGDPVDIQVVPEGGQKGTDATELTESSKHDIYNSTILFIINKQQLTT